MRAASGMILTLALIAGPIGTQAQVLGEAAASGDEVRLPVDYTAPVDVYHLSKKGASGNVMHGFPPKNSNAARNLEAANIGAATPPLTYHGGPIMPSATIYTIFWIPPTLQDGSATGVSSKYIGVTNFMLAHYPGHGIDNNNTQYYRTSPTQYVGNAGAFGKTFTDTSPYPASGCNDPAAPGTNCITDAQMQAEIQSVIAAQKWPNGGLNNIYFLFTSSGEGSCGDASNTFCAYVDFCAYHTATTGSPTIIYAIMPYADPNVCQNPGQSSPNADAFADTATTAASHELSEAITDPEPNSGWINSAGNEIGDLCAYKYGTNTWDSGKANQNWNGVFFELQQEWDNHRGLCVQVGP
jgi:hypothetical protein